MQGLSKVQQVFNSEAAQARITLEQLFVSIKQEEFRFDQDRKEPDKYNASTIRSLKLLEETRREYAPSTQRRTCSRRAVEDTTIFTFSDRTQIVKDRSGNILKTRDAGNLTREFKRDDFSGEVLMRTFGQWRRLAAGQKLMDDGTLVQEDGNKEIHQKLDGSILVICKNNGAVFESNHLQKTDIAVYPNGLVLIQRKDACGNEEQIVRHK